jgi:predicted RNA-binding protein associated with RNAse of E/G family
MQLAVDEVSYTDLILDVWVINGALRWEDEDELDEAVRSGLASGDDRTRIARARDVLTRGHAGIVREVRRTLGFSRA